MEETVGSNIDRLRRSAEMSQEKLGQLLGTYLKPAWSRQAVSAAEKGKRSFTAAELVAIATVLHTTVYELLQSEQAVSFPTGRDLRPGDLASAILADSRAVEAHVQVLTWQRLEHAVRLRSRINEDMADLRISMTWLKGQVSDSPEFRERLERERDTQRRADDEAMSQFEETNTEMDQAQGGPWGDSDFVRLCDELLSSREAQRG